MFRPRKPDKPPKSTRTRRNDRIVWSAVLGILVLMLGLIPLYFLATSRRPSQTNLSHSGPPVVKDNTPVHPPPTTVGETVVDPTPLALQTPEPIPTVSLGDQRFAVLLLGYGGGGHDGTYLTDSIMVVIVDPVQKTMTLLSVPRDVWVPLLFDGRTAAYNKVNTAYAFAKDPSLFPDRLDKYDGGHGPGTFTTDTISRLLGVPITYYLALDFDGFRQMINAVGGVDVDVPTGFVARYPANDDPTVDASWITIRFNAGLQHMDGERAIEYARARETLDDSGEGTDFARSRRQRLIIEAFKQRMFQPGGMLHAPQILAIASQHVDTNYAIPAVAQLSQLALGWKDVRFYQAALTANNYLEEATGSDGAYLLVPSAPDHSWSQVRAFTRRLWDDPPTGVAMASTTVVVENDSGSPGLGSRVSAALIGLGYNVADPTTGAPRERSQLLDRTGGKATSVIDQLRKDLVLKDLSVADPTAGSAGASDFVATSTTGQDLVLELGADESNLTVSVPDDALAPSSNVGVVKFGVWSPEAAFPTATPPPVPIVPVEGAVPTSTPPSVLPTSVPVPAHATPIKVSGNPNEVIVPNLIGLPEAQAQRVINDSDLMTTYVNYQTDNEVADHKFFLSIAPGAVLSQSPRAGTKVPPGTRIALAVRKQ